MGIDWTALGEEAVDLLRRYLMIDTTNPPGNEIEGAKFLAAVLGRDGIASETVESAPGRANLVARLAGDGSLPGIVSTTTSTSSTPTGATGRWTRSAARSATDTSTGAARST